MPLPPAEHDGFVAGVAFSLHGRVPATGGGDGLVRLWDVTGDDVSLRMTVPGHTDAVNAVAFSPRGRVASAVADGTVRLWAGDTGAPVAPALHGPSDSVASAAFSPDGRFLACGGDDGTVHVWQTGTGTLPHRALDGRSGPVWGIAFGRGGLLATACRDGSARLWDVRTGQPIGERLTGHEDALTHLAFSPSGDLLATASDDDTARLWPLTARTP